MISNKPFNSFLGSICSHESGENSCFVEPKRKLVSQSAYKCPSHLPLFWELRKHIWQKWPDMCIVSQFTRGEAGQEIGSVCLPSPSTASWTADILLGPFTAEARPGQSRGAQTPADLASRALHSRTPRSGRRLSVGSGASCISLCAKPKPYGAIALSATFQFMLLFWGAAGPNVPSDALEATLSWIVYFCLKIIIATILECFVLVLYNHIISFNSHYSPLTM